MPDSDLSIGAPALGKGPRVEGRDVEHQESRPAAIGGALVAPRNSTWRAVLYMTMAALLFPVLNASVKYLGPRYPMPEILWVRFTGHIALCLIFLLPIYGIGLLRTTRPGIQATRAVLMFLASTMFYLGVQLIPLPTATAIAFAGPIIVTALSVPLLRERVGPRRWTAVLVGFVGAAIIIRPGTDVIQWGAILVLLDALCYAVYQILSRKVGSTDPAAVSITLAGAGGFVICSAVLPFTDIVMPATAMDAAILASIGFWGFLAHFFVVKAFQWGPAAVVAPFGYGELVGATLLGYLLFGELPDSWTWVGAITIVASGLYILYREQRLRRLRPRT